MNDNIIPKECISEIYQRTIKTLENKILNVKDIMFSNPTPIENSIRNGLSDCNKIRGIYKIIHKPTGYLKYIGKGNINERRVQHMRIFRNDGNAKYYISEENDTLSKVFSAAGQKMYKFDKNISNWYISYTIIDDSIIDDVENMLILNLKPDFNRRMYKKSEVPIKLIGKFW